MHTVWQEWTDCFIRLWSQYWAKERVWYCKLPSNGKMFFREGNNINIKFCPFNFPYLNFLSILFFIGSNIHQVTKSACLFLFWFSCVISLRKLDCINLPITVFHLSNTKSIWQEVSPKSTPDLKLFLYQ